MGTSDPKGLSSKDVVTVAELAELLHVPRSWVYGQTRCAEQSGFPLIRCGKHIRCVPAEVVGWLRGQGSRCKD